MQNKSEMLKRIKSFKKLTAEAIPDSVADWLIRNGFFTAPASTKFHGSYAGGLYDHSLCVTQNLLNLTEKLGLSWSRKESPIIIGMLHDVCKCDSYLYNTEKGCYVWNPNQQPGHGTKSLQIVQSLMYVTPEEADCM